MTMIRTGNIGFSGSGVMDSISTGYADGPGAVVEHLDGMDGNYDGIIESDNPPDIDGYNQMEKGNGAQTGSSGRSREEPEVAEFMDMQRLMRQEPKLAKAMLKELKLPEDTPELTRRQAVAAYCQVAGKEMREGRTNDAVTYPKLSNFQYIKRVVTPEQQSRGEDPVSKLPGDWMAHIHEPKAAKTQSSGQPRESSQASASDTDDLENKKYFTGSQITPRSRGNSGPAWNPITPEKPGNVSPFAFTNGDPKISPPVSGTDEFKGGPPDAGSFVQSDDTPQAARARDEASQASKKAGSSGPSKSGTNGSSAAEHKKNFMGAADDWDPYVDLNKLAAHSEQDAAAAKFVEKLLVFSKNVELNAAMTGDPSRLSPVVAERLKPDYVDKLPPNDPRRALWARATTAFAPEGVEPTYMYPGTPAPSQFPPVPPSGSKPTFHKGTLVAAAGLAALSVASIVLDRSQKAKGNAGENNGND